MSAEATAWVWRHSTRSGAELCVHLAVADVVNDAHGNEFWMTVPNLAAKARCSEDTVRRALTALCVDEQLTLLEAGGGRRKPSRYRFEMPVPAAVEIPPHHATLSEAPGEAETPARREGYIQETLAWCAETPAPREGYITQENSSTTNSTGAPRRRRTRDELFEAVAEACSYDWQNLTATERSRVNAACRELRALREPATPDDVRGFVAAWRATTRRDIPITPQGITGNWTRMRAGRMAVRQVELDRLGDMGVIPQRLAAPHDDAVGSTT